MPIIYYNILVKQKHVIIQYVPTSPIYFIFSSSLSNSVSASGWLSGDNWNISLVSFNVYRTTQLDENKSQENGKWTSTTGSGTSTTWVLINKTTFTRYNIVIYHLVNAKI